MSHRYTSNPPQLYLFVARVLGGFILTFYYTWHFRYIQGVGFLNLHEFTFMFTISFMARRTLLIILRLNILCCQRQIVHILIEVHISIIIQVTRDISNIETIVRWPSTTWFTCFLHVRGNFLLFWARCIANSLAWLDCINYHLKTLIYMFYRKFFHMFRGCI